MAQSYKYIRKLDTDNLANENNLLEPLREHSSQPPDEAQHSIQLNMDQNDKYLDKLSKDTSFSPRLLSVLLHSQTSVVAPSRRDNRRCCNNAPAPCIFSPKKYLWSGPSPRASFWSAMYLYAENAPGRTVMYPKTDSRGLSRILDILYSKLGCNCTSINTRN